MKRLPSRERLPSHLLQKSGSKQKPSLFRRSFMLNFSIVIILSILLGIIVLSVQMHSSMKRKEMEALASTLRTGVEQVDDQTQMLRTAFFPSGTSCPLPENVSSAAMTQIP